MSSSYEMNSPVRATLTVTVEKEDVNKAIEKAYTNLKRTARVRGFRKGKAPKSVLQRLYGSAVLQDVQGELVNSHLLGAMLEHELDPLSQPEVDMQQLASGDAFEFKASFEVRPKIEKVDYSDIQLERLNVTVDPADVDTELEKVRGSMASVSDLPEPRPAQEGDVAVISLKRWTDGKWEEGGLREQEVIIGGDQAPKQLDEGLVGMTIDEEKVIDMGSDSDLEEDRMRFMVTLNGLKERKLPELDDELAKDTGKYETLDELKADIEKRLLSAANQQEDHRLKQALFEALKEKNPIELPPSLVSRHAHALKEQLMGQLASMPEEQAQGIMQSFEANTMKTAEEMVHQSLLTLAISKLEDIKVDDSDLDAELEKQAEASGVPVPMLKAELNKGGRRQDMLNYLLEQKIFDFAKSSVKIKEVDKLTPVEPKNADIDAAATDDVSGEEKSDDAEKETVDAEDTKTKSKTNTTKSTTNKASTKTTAGASKKKAATKKAATKKTTAKKVATKKAATKKAAAKKTASKKDASKE